MKFLIALILWCILFVLCWPLALLVLVAFPLIWLLALPFRIVYIVVEGLLALLRALFMLPSRALARRA